MQLSHHFLVPMKNNEHIGLLVYKNLEDDSECVILTSYIDYYKAFANAKRFTMDEMQATYGLWQNPIHASIMGFMQKPDHGLTAICYNGGYKPVTEVSDSFVVHRYDITPSSIHEAKSLIEKIYNADNIDDDIDITYIFSSSSATSLYVCSYDDVRDAQWFTGDNSVCDHCGCKDDDCCAEECDDGWSDCNQPAYLGIYECVSEADAKLVCAGRYGVDPSRVSVVSIDTIVKKFPSSYGHLKSRFH